MRRTPAALRSAPSAHRTTLAALALAAGGLLATPAVATAQDAASPEMAPLLLQGMEYRMVGPTRGGRVTTVAGHRAHPSTFYMGATGGGVWKTEDWGERWAPISDGYFETGSIGSIRIADTDPNVVYVGTGSDGLRSNVIVGKGMYRSDDAGSTWRHIGLRDVGQIGAVLIHPEDAEVVYAAAIGDPFGKSEARGIYRSRDGGASWDHIHFVSDSVGAVDLEFHPTNPDVIYAAMWRAERKPWTIISGMEEDAEEDGIWRSEDGGDSWEYVRLGLESNLIGKIDFAVTPADPDRVYALVETREPQEGLYRSDDAGRTWRMVSNHKPLMDRPFYYTNVDVSPVDPDELWVSATQFWYSNDGGESWERRGTPHGDNHDLWINPDDPRIMVQSNDGGANVTRDAGRTWSTQLNQPTAELYSADVDNREPYWIYSGQQDNSTIRLPSDRTHLSTLVGPEGYWEAVGGCETGPVVPRWDDHEIVYANCKGRFGRYSARTGQEQQYYVGAANMYGTNPANLTYRFQRVVPIEVSPHDAGVVYHGSQFVHRTTNGGIDWERISGDLTAFREERQMVSGGPITRDATGEEHYSTLYAVEESPGRPGVNWVGANDGPIHITRDGGASWTDITPPDLPPEGRVQTIDPSPHDAATAYVAVYRYLLGDYAPYLYRTDDYGATWTRLTDGANGIPADHPTRVIREDTEVEGLLYAGTEFGMFVSFDDGANWAELQQNLPATPITDIKVHQGDLVLSTMGRGFWVMDDLSRIRSVARTTFAMDEPHLFEPNDAVRRRGGGFGFGPQPAVRPRMSTPGVVIDYWIPEGFSEEVTLAVVDRVGNELRSWTAGSGARAPSGGAGAHRFVWDMTMPSPSGRGGFLVLPGTYEVLMSAGSASQRYEVEVEMDPRVAADGITQGDLAAQLALAVEVGATIREAAEVNTRVQSARSRAQGTTKEGLDALDARLNTKQGGSYQRPMLISQLGYLYSMFTRADQRPGRDAYEQHDRLRAELESIQEELSRLERIITEAEAAG